MYRRLNRSNKITYS